MGEEQIDKIKAEVAQEGKKSGVEMKQSVFHEILRSDLPPSEKDSSRLKREAFALLAAGTITTASTLSLVTYFILADPEVEKRLKRELKDITADFPEKVPHWADLEKLPYLQGCIKEALRFVLHLLFSYVHFTDSKHRIGRFFRRNTRIAPDVALQYKHWTIPKNVSHSGYEFVEDNVDNKICLQTPVAMSICFMHMDPEVYPEPYKFKPERWIGNYDPRMNRNFVPFTKGSRNCLGMK